MLLLMLWLESREEREEALPRYNRVDKIIRSCTSNFGQHFCPPTCVHHRATISESRQTKRSRGVTALDAVQQCLTQHARGLKLRFHVDRFIGSPRSTLTLVKRPQSLSPQRTLHLRVKTRRADRGSMLLHCLSLYRRRHFASCNIQFLVAPAIDDQLDVTASDFRKMIAVRSGMRQWRPILR